ncbi:MAG: hypothetical protein JWQ72_801 [Polaromonas sp.]|nr:hypothetical protein [Polaromonas sp.]
MASQNFPETSGSSGSSTPGSSSSNGAATGMGMDPVGDASHSATMTGADTMDSADLGYTSGASMAGSSDSGATSGGAMPSASRLTAMAHDAVDRVAEMAGRLSGSQAKAMEASKNMVQEKPMVAIGAAMALGLLIGRLTSR